MSDNKRLSGLRAWGIEFDQIAVELDEYLLFNRHRAQEHPGATHQGFSPHLQRLWSYPNAMSGNTMALPRRLKPENLMGETLADLVVTNLFNKARMSLRVLVDTGSSYLTVTDEIARALGFDPEECRVRVVILANGRRVRVPVIGPLQIQFEDRECTVGAYVMGDQCLLGFISLECMDLVVDPKGQPLVGAHLGGPLFRI
jgi:clan AA aspartic protease